MTLKSWRDKNCKDKRNSLQLGLIRRRKILRKKKNKDIN